MRDRGVSGSPCPSPCPDDDVIDARASIEGRPLVVVLVLIAGRSDDDDADIAVGSLSPVLLFPPLMVMLRLRVWLLLVVLTELSALLLLLFSLGDSG